MTATKSTIINGNATIQTYLRDGVNLPVSPIKEFIVIETGPIAANTAKRLDLFLYGHTMMLESVWSDPVTGSNYAMDFKVFWGTNEIFYFNLTSNQIPYIFPPIVVTSDLSIEVKPTAAVNKILVYASPCAIYDRIVFP